MSPIPWLRWFADPVPPGAGRETPRPKALALLLMALWLAAQVVARYRFGLLADERWAIVHLLIGFTAFGILLAVFHGVAFLRQVRARTWFVLGSGVLFFCGFWYLGRVDSYHRWFDGLTDPDLPMSRVLPFFYFSAMSVTFRLLLPFLLARPILGLGPRDLGLLPSGSTRHILWPVYLLLFFAVLPFVIHASGTPSFLRNYPQCHDLLVGRAIPLWPFLLYQGAYLMVFVSGESFWRGYMTFGMERDFGIYGIALMLVPYVTSHFGKPMPEALGAIAAGSVLGFLALKHRTVWLGVAVHYGVALTMDLLALHGRGLVVM